MDDGPEYIYITWPDRPQTDAYTSLLCTGVSYMLLWMRPEYILLSSFQAFRITTHC